MACLALGCFLRFGILAYVVFATTAGRPMLREVLAER